MKISKVKKVRVVGVIPSFAFQRAKYCVLELHRKLPQRFPSPEIIGLLELDWNEKLSEWRQVFGREYWCLRRPVAVFFDDKFIGSDLELLKLTTLGNIVLGCVPRKDACFMKDRFRKDYISHLKKAKRIYCYLDICIDDTYVGTMSFELYSDVLPRTCENFKRLCLGQNGSLLSYKGSRIHRIVKGGWLQGGDIQYKTGGGGFSVFCDPLEDENYSVSHDRRGVLSMASGGRHRNASQFFVTLQPAKWMDTNFVAFGRLVEGSHVLKLIENVDTLYECPLKRIEIKACGKVDLEDVEDLDAAYREIPFPRKKGKIFETVSDQVVRMVVEALTEALARRERAPDVLDEGDVPSKMNLQLYFQGLYSIPEDVLEGSAQYLRQLRRQLFRTLQPSATEVVEVLMYDLLMAVLTRMTTLDDVRESLGRQLYDKMIGGIDMEFELCQKPYVKKLVNQIVSTAQSIVSLVSKKLLKMKIMSTKTRAFQEKMENWVLSFVRQETFMGHAYHISDRPPGKLPSNRPTSQPAKVRAKREGGSCCPPDQAEDKDWKKLGEKYPSEDVCCMGDALFRPASLQFSDYFTDCMWKMKRVPGEEVQERVPLMDLIEAGRFKLRWMRKGENALKPKALSRVEKKIRKWMEEVVYTPETSWIKYLIFNENEQVLDHLEEIMYGAMTAGLLEMYYFYEQYLKTCGGKKQKILHRVVYPDDSESSSSEEVEENAILVGVEEGPKEVATTEAEGPPCPCGHPCCVCVSDPNYRAPTPPPSLEDDQQDEVIPESPPSSKVETPAAEVEAPCGPDAQLVDLNALLAEKMALKPDKIDIRSFKWLRPYILSKGCDLKTEFATRAHKWIDGERFDPKGFISKHSMASRASLLSLSVSLAEIITDKNQIKSEIKDFIYDLWDLYFCEMFKEAVLESPPEEETVEERKSEEVGEEDRKLSGNEDEICKKILAETPDFDFSKFCARFDVIADAPEQQMTAAEEEEREKDEEPTEAEPQDEPPIAGPLADDSDKQPEPKTSFEDPDEEPETKAVAPSKKENPPEPMDQAQAERVSDERKKGEKRRKKSPIVVEEVIEESSGDESRHIPPYVVPFWIKFLTELTKQALGALAKISRLPRRLYFQPDADLDFDDKMKEWFDFNAFNPRPTQPREIMDYIALHHKSLDNLEDTARSYLKKKKYTELLNRCTRFSSAEAVADEIVLDVIKTAMKDEGDADTVQLYLSNVISSAVASSRRQSQTSYDDHENDQKDFETDLNDSENEDD